MNHLPSAQPDVDFTRHDHRQAEKLNQLPQCEDCTKFIQDEHYFDVYGDILCEDCMTLRYRRNTNDY